jgi:hypothetical protein
VTDFTASGGSALL